MKITLVVSLILSTEIENVISYMDVADILATPIAQNMAVVLTENSPYHSYPIAKSSIENDGETLVFTIDTDYFDNYRHYDKAEDFEIFFNLATAKYPSNLANAISQTVAAYDIGEELQNALYLPSLLDKYTDGIETEWDIEGCKEPEVKDLDKWGDKDDGLLYRFTVTIE